MGGKLFAMSANVQLVAYRFDGEGAFEGQLLGALERVESGGGLKIREVLFVGREPETGEFVAMAAHGRQPGSLVEPLVGFRLDASERARATRRALAAFDRGADPHPLRALAESLPPGGAVAAVLVEHRWADAVEDAVARTGGAKVLDDFVGDTELTALIDALSEAVRR